MDNKCKCGGRIDFISTTEKEYKNLGWCIDCDLRYINKNGKWKYISKAEFRRIVDRQVR